MRDKHVLGVWLWVMLLAVGLWAQEAEVPTAEVPGVLPAEAPPREIPPPAGAETPALAEPAPAAGAPAAEKTPEPAAKGELITLTVDKAETPITVDAKSGRPELLSISLDNVPLQEVVRMFTRVSGANIVAGTNLQGSVTVSLKDVEWEPALRVILDSSDLTLVEKKPGIYAIIGKRELAAEPVTSETIFLKYTTVSNVIGVVRGMLVSSNASVSGFASGNALIVQETGPRLSAIRETVNKIDKPRPQVFLEAKFLELSDSAIKKLGVNWQMLGDNPNGGMAIGGRVGWDQTQTRTWDYNDATTLQNKQSDYDKRYKVDGQQHSYDNMGVEQSTILGMAGPEQFQDSSIDGTAGHVTKDMIEQGRDITSTLTHDVADKFSRVIVDNRAMTLDPVEFSLLLSALKTDTGISIISNPKILVASGESAYILVGSQEPIIKSEYNPDSKTTTYTLDKYVDTGVQVQVTPVVNTDSNVTVKIIPQISNVERYVETPSGDIPVFNRRKVQSEFNLENGRTVAIGGLTKTGDRDVVKKVPILGDIPIIGTFLFRHTSKEKAQEEIVIFITVNLAKADGITEAAGVPSEGKLIYRHMAEQQKNAMTESNAKAKEKTAAEKNKKKETKAEETIKPTGELAQPVGM